MPRVCIASSNPVKSAAIRSAFLAVFPAEEHEFLSGGVFSCEPLDRERAEVPTNSGFKALNLSAN
jgi:hypothetical protein